jgi:hypothetical protein
MKFIILGDRYNKGMKSKGAIGLVKINRNKTILGHQYKSIKSVYPRAQIIYVYGFDNKKFLQYLESEYPDIIPIYNPDYENTNYTHTLNLASDFISKDTFILFGDSIFNKNIFNNFNKKLGSQIFINKKIKNKLGCILSNEAICNISFDLSLYLSDIYYINSKDSKTLKELIKTKKNKNSFIFEIINKMIDVGVKFYPIISNSKNTIIQLQKNKIKI